MSETQHRDHLGASLPWCAYVLGYDLGSAWEQMMTWWGLRDDYASGAIPFDGEERELKECQSTLHSATIQLSASEVLARVGVIELVEGLTRLDTAITKLFDWLVNASHGEALPDGWEHDGPPDMPNLGELRKIAERAFSHDPALEAWYRVGEAFQSSVTFPDSEQVLPEFERIVQNMALDWLTPVQKVLMIGPTPEVLKRLDFPFINQETGTMMPVELDRYMRQHLLSDSDSRVLLRFSDDGLTFLTTWYETGAISDTRLRLLKHLAQHTGRWVHSNELRRALGCDVPSTISRLKDNLRRAVKDWRDSGHGEIPALDESLIENQRHKGYRLVLHERHIEGLPDKKSP